LITDLAGRSGARGGGRLLDLAYGTGQLSFALHSYFEEVWAVDQEPGMVDLAREKAEAAGAGHIRFLTSAAEDLAAPEESFDLITVGNAFHRLRREAVAASILRWLRPGGFLALVWGGLPWDGEAPWQQVLSATMQRWRTRMADDSRIPPGYDQQRRERPDLAVLRGSGFQFAGSYQFPTAHEWTPETLAGFLFFHLGSVPCGAGRPGSRLRRGSPARAQLPCGRRAVSADNQVRLRAGPPPSVIRLHRAVRPGAGPASAAG